MDVTQAPIPAATLVIFRERSDGPPEFLMVQRSAAMRFASGAWVFPGGRVDGGDVALATSMADRGTDVTDLAGRIAAVRETVEEAGVAIGVRFPDLGAARQALYAGTPFAEVLGDGRFDADALVPFARWLPHRGVLHRVFDTRFYLAKWPEGAPPPQVDGNENNRLTWISAQALLDAAAAGDAQVIFPTLRNLERLAQFDSFDAAVAHARAHPVEVIAPYIEPRDGVPHLCIPEGIGYPITSEPMSRVQRA